MWNFHASAEVKPWKLPCLFISEAVVRWLTERLPEGLGGVEEFWDKLFLLVPVCINV